MADVTELVQVIAHEREGRDRGWWDQMADCYHADSEVYSMWYTGSGRGFVDASREMAARGDHARHRLAVPSVHLNADRAVACLPMAIELRVSIDGIQADLTSYARGIYRLEKRCKRFKIVELSTIYERDTLVAAIPGDPLHLDRQHLATLPDGYRMLAYYFGLRGYPVDATMPSDDRPDLADALVTRVFDWLGEATEKEWNR